MISFLKKYSLEAYLVLTFFLGVGGATLGLIFNYATDADDQLLVGNLFRVGIVIGMILMTSTLIYKKFSDE